MEDLDRVPLNEQDPSIPDFRFSEDERKKMRENMTEEEIDEKESLVRKGLNRKKIEGERLSDK